MCIFISSFIKRSKVAFSEKIFLKYILEYDFQDNKEEFLSLLYYQGAITLTKCQI